jgi:hypothetical protein
VTQYVYKCSVTQIKLEGSHFKNSFFTKHVGKYPPPAQKIVLRGISEGIFHKALITARSWGIFSVTGSIIGCFSVIVSRMRSANRIPMVGLRVLIMAVLACCFSPDFHQLGICLVEHALATHDETAVFSCGLNLLSGKLPNLLRRSQL